MSTTRAAAVGLTAAAPVVAAVDLLTTRERHADELALAWATLLTRRGGRDITVTTHWAALAEQRHVALVVEVSGLDAAVVTETLAVTAGAGSETPSGCILDGTFSGPAELAPVLAEVLDAHRSRASGRVVVFPGSTTLTGTVTVADALATRIDRVQVLGAAPDPDGHTPLVTRGFVRPRWSGGLLVLHTQPAVGGTLVPFETPNPTPCCAAHS